MTTDASHLVRSTVRVSVVGDAEPRDLVVPRWMTVADLAARYVETAGPGAEPAVARRLPTLLTPTGHPLDAEVELQHAGVENGDVLVATYADPPSPSTSSPMSEVASPARPVVSSVGPAAPGAAGGRRTARPQAAVGSAPRGHGGGDRAREDVAGGPSPHRADSRPGGPRRAVLLGLGAACAAGAAAVAGVSAGAETVRWVCVGVFVLGAVILAVPAARDRVGGRLQAAGSAAFAAAAGFAAASTDATGGLLLGLSVAALCATAAAAVVRAWLDPAEDDLADVTLLVGGTASALGIALLLLGTSVAAFLAVAFAASVVAARLLPYLVVDVPDEALLDLDRLQVTAWSAREAAQSGRRRRVVVRPEGVAAVVDRSRRLLTAGTVVISGVVAVAGPVLVHDAASDLLGVSRVAMVLLGAAALALVARSVRARVPRLSLRLGAATAAVWTGTLLLGGADAGAHTVWWSFAAMSCLGALVVGVALALGQGWRSVWWARAADVAEALAVVLVVAALPLASGLFGAVRSLVS